MSLNAHSSADADSRNIVNSSHGVRVILRSTDQYHLWKARINDACWSATRLSVFDITDEKCDELLEEYDAGESKIDTVGKCWIIITNALHDELYLKLAHVQQGHISTLVSEIRAALLVNTAEDVQHLRLELYAATMQANGGDLQTYVSYIIQRRDKLKFHEVTIPDDELTTVFLKGLHAIFQPVQVHFSVKGALPETFDKTLEIVRNFAATPVVYTELCKLKSPGLSQNVFAAMTKEKALCKKYAVSGTCSFGDKCKFMHANNTQQSEKETGAKPSLRCSHCKKRGHSENVCRSKLAGSSPPTTLVAETGVPSRAPTDHDGEAPVNPFVFMFTTKNMGPAECNPAEHILTSTGADLNICDQNPPNQEGVLHVCYTDKAHYAHALSVKIEPASGWILDSGATTCATNSEQDCHDIRTCNINVTAAGCNFNVSRIGTIVIKASDTNGIERDLTITDCLISDKFPYKLLAMQKFTNKGYVVTIIGDIMNLYNATHKIAFVANRDSESGLFFLRQAIRRQKEKHAPDAEMLLAKTRAGCPSNASSELWKLHLRHGHRNFTDVCRQYGLPIPKNLPTCTSCVMGKSHQHSHFTGGYDRATRKAQGFHSDFRGPFSTETPSGAKYLLTITDDYSRRIFAFLCKSQSEWLDIWTRFVLRVEAEIGHPNCISWLLSDNGSVYRSGAMNTFCANKGIQQKFSSPYGQWMNGVAERNMRTIGEMAVTTIIHANMSAKTWGWAMLLACEVLNRTSEKAEVNVKAGVEANFSRLERWHGKRLPNQTRSLFPFGCLCFKHVPNELRNKLDAHAVPMAYLGIDPSTRSYVLGSLYELYTSVAVEVTFFENVFPFRKIKGTNSPASLLWGSETSLLTGDPRLGMFEAPTDDTIKMLDRKALKSIGAIPDSYSAQEEPTSAETDELVVSEPADTDFKETNDNSSTQLRRSSRVSVPIAPQTNQRYRIPGTAPYVLNVAGVSIPESDIITEATLQQFTPRDAYAALKSKQRDMWILAMNREKACHAKNGTFGAEVANPPVKCVPSNWVFKIKYRGGPVSINSLSEKQYKARVVIRGQYMEEGMHFNDTFAPVAKQSTLRAVLAFATKHSCSLKSGDVETAFLTSDMDCEAYIKLPPFWGAENEEITTDNVAQKPRLLLKGVPGIPQGSRLFNQTFTAHLATMGYFPSNADKCLFINKTLKEKNCVLLWVDDFVHMHEKESTFLSFMAGVRAKFTVPNAGPLTVFLGMQIVHDIKAKNLVVNQTSSIDVLLERANMTDCNPTSCPCVAGFVFTKGEVVSPDKDNITEYRSLIAMANFLSCWTRPDITYVVNKLCKYMSCPNNTHWQALKHLLRYLKGTRSDGICYDYSNDTSKGIYGYTDSSFADCIDTGRSTLAYVFFYGPGLLSWYSKLNTYVTTCTNHSEYCALAHGCKECEWLVLLFKDLEPKVTHTPVPILVDNSGVVSMVFNPVAHQSNKHVRIGCHYSRELAAEKIIAPQRIPTQDNLADVFTKALAGPLFNKLTSTFMHRTEPKAQAATILMFKAGGNDNDPSQPPGNVKPKSDFHHDWPYVYEVKDLLGADEYEVIETNEYFQTGRRKYNAIFYKVNDEGKRDEVARRVAMRLLSNENKPYMVCQRNPMPASFSPTRLPVPLVPSYSPPPTLAPAPAYTPPSPPLRPVRINIGDESKASIDFAKPQPILTCRDCNMLNTAIFALLQCTSCNGKQFTWSCACTAPEPQPRPSIRSRRVRNARSDEPIKYNGPIGHAAFYHHIDCPTIGVDAQVTTMDVAKALKMKKAVCCYAHRVADGV